MTTDRERKVPSPQQTVEMLRSQNPADRETTALVIESLIREKEALRKECDELRGKLYAATPWDGKQ